jgi:hypothetical protein
MTPEVHPVLDWKQIEFVSRPLLSKVGTISSDGSPHVTPTWYVYEDGKFTITTAERAVKVQNIRRDNRVSLLIDDAYKYVIVKGRAEINKRRDVQKETARLAVRYLGEEGAGRILPDIMKIKHVIIEVTPRDVLSYNL